MSQDEDLDLLSAIWILSANDENSLITYRGIVNRLGLSDEQHVRALVLGRRDLFRLRVLAPRLDVWKEDMKANHHVPVWISEIKNKAERLAEIDKLTIDDVFRNQFRIELGAKKCDLKTIDWGLQYIERMRAAKSKSRDERRNRTSTYLSLGSVVVAFLALIASAWFQYEGLNAQNELKKYEVTFKPRQESYLEFMSAFEDAHASSESKNYEHLRDAGIRMQKMVYAMEPFLKNADQRIALSGIMDQYIQFARIRATESPTTDVKDATERLGKAESKYNEAKTFFRITLFRVLFSE